MTTMQLGMSIIMETDPEKLKRYKQLQKEHYEKCEKYIQEQELNNG